MVPQGGHTGLVGGRTPRDGEVVLSLGRLQELGEIDRAASQVTAGAGVTLERLQQHAAAAGLDFPLTTAPEARRRSAARWPRMQAGIWRSATGRSGR